MKTKSLLLMTLLVFVLTGCQSGPAPQTPAVTAAPVEAGPTVEALPSTPTPAAPTTQAPTTAPENTPTNAAPAPTATAVEPAAPTPTTAPVLPTPLPATDAAPQETAAISGESGLLPVAGDWSGSATGLLLSFTITHENGQAVLSNLAVLWLGPGACTMDLLNPAPTVIEPESFSRFYEDDDMRYRLTGRVEAPDLISGKILVHYTGCGDRTLPWVAAPQK